MPDRRGDAYAAMGRGDWIAGLESWHSLLSQNPADPEAMNGVASCLMSLGRLPEAEALLERGVIDHPSHVAMAFSHVWTAHYRADRETALTRWATLRERFPNETVPFTDAAALLDVGERFDEAAALIAEAAARFPGHVGVLALQGSIAQHRTDWRTAQRCWSAVRAAEPGRTDAWLGEIVALRGLRRTLAIHDLMAEALLTFPSDAGLQAVAQTIADHDLVLRFQSVGESCEFGLVQRLVQAEPVSLLRWASVSPGALLDALDNDFAGVGDPVQTTLDPIDGEYYSSDKRYGLGMHTHIASTRDPAKTFDAVTGRLRYLAEQQLMAMRDASHVFVYQTAAVLPDDMLVRIFRSLRRHGPAALLCVRTADAGHVCGRLDVIEPGLLFGYLDKLGPQRLAPGQPWDPTRHWFDLCRRTEAALKEQTT